MVYDKEIQTGNPNRAALAVARKLVAYMLAVDRRKQSHAARAARARFSSHLDQPAPPPRAPLDASSRLQLGRLASLPDIGEDLIQRFSGCRSRILRQQQSLW
jgi:hypothetical protein